MPTTGTMATRTSSQIGYQIKQDLEGMYLTVNCLSNTAVVSKITGLTPIGSVWIVQYYLLMGFFLSSVTNIQHTVLNGSNVFDSNGSTSYIGESLPYTFTGPATMQFSGTGVIVADSTGVASVSFTCSGSGNQNKANPFSGRMVATRIA